MAIDFIAPGDMTEQRGHWFRYDLAGPIVLASDVLVIVFASIICGFAYDFLRVGSFNINESAALGTLFAVLFVMLTRLRGLYGPLELLQPLRQLWNAIVVWLVVAGFLTVMGFALKAGAAVSRGAAISFVLLGFVCVAGLRVFWHAFMRRALAKGKFASRRVVVIGDDDGLERGQLTQRLAPFGLAVAARVRLSPGIDDEAATSAAIADIVAGIRGSQIEEIVVALGTGRLGLADRIVAGLRILPLPIKLMLDKRLVDLVGRPIHHFGPGLVAVEMHRAPMTLAERCAKRALDIAIAGPTLLLIAPLMIMVAILIRLESRGPILFKQMRNGFNNQPFQILKFRSMRVLEDGGQIRQASRHDNRVTKVGRWIRKLSIDELPQLWNVLRGEMSIVGPRPHALAHDIHYEKLIGDYPYRQHVKPGLTGWAQVNGSRGETPTTESMAERIRLDLWYVENASVWLDIRIIARTFITLFNVKQVY
ncbi:undecaprenyl-phosphate glucose phosphotransferase [Bosea sp. TND4EK4]|uniref:undecaprenyl-phosphate glucose phosphotransferase n=1 Tax=Bosea sp. TND4EK4 TaxID=1907408 RepID=UPI000956C5AA|nr:undecaprenyl-phosphate glucose phosphotransferase [Bosea sp. TND4EK4]SIR47278.1 putative colanic acid biosysnthesis UDP-glucose lipid carrier transferase [Bosea sp. TND4EK4]